MRTRGGLEQLSAKLEPKLEPVAPKREPAVIKSEPRVKTEFKKEEKEQESSAGEEDDGMTEYERKRLANIQRNLEFMKTMGVSTVRSLLADCKDCCCSVLLLNGIDWDRPRWRRALRSAGPSLSRSRPSA